MYLDANNLYEWAMSGNLLVNGFKRAKKIMIKHWLGIFS